MALHKVTNSRICTSLRSLDPGAGRRDRRGARPWSRWEDEGGMSSEEGHSGQAESAEDAKDVGSGRETPASTKGACSDGGGGGAAARQVEVGDAALLSPRSGELSPNTRKLIENLAGGVDEVREGPSEDAPLPAAVGRDGGAEAGPGAGGVAGAALQSLFPGGQAMSGLALPLGLGGMPAAGAQLGGGGAAALQTQAAQQLFMLYLQNQHANLLQQAALGASTGGASPVKSAPAAEGGEGGGVAGGAAAGGAGEVAGNAALQEHQQKLQEQHKALLAQLHQQQAAQQQQQLLQELVRRHGAATGSSGQSLSNALAGGAGMAGGPQATAASAAAVVQAAAAQLAVSQAFSHALAAGAKSMAAVALAAQQHQQLQPGEGNAMVKPAGPDGGPFGGPNVQVARAHAHTHPHTTTITTNTHLIVSGPTRRWRGRSCSMSTYSNLEVAMSCMDSPLRSFWGMRGREEEMLIQSRQRPLRLWSQQVCETPLSLVMRILCCWYMRRYH